MKKLLLLALGSLLLMPASHAAVIYSGLQNIPIPTTFDGTYINIDTAATAGTSFSGWDINPFFGGAGFANSSAFQPVRTGTGNNDAILNLLFGTVVDGGLSYSSGFGGSGDPSSHLGSAPGQFAVGTEGYLGFRFTTDSSSGPYYGWMRVVLTNNTSGGVITDWAYDNTGASIVAGVPEPGRSTLLLFGMAGLAVRRRRSSKTFVASP